MARNESDDISALAFELRRQFEDSPIDKIESELSGRGSILMYLRVNSDAASTVGWWLESLDREARRAQRLYELPPTPIRSFRPTRPANGGLEVRKISKGSLEAVLGGYGAVEFFLSQHPLTCGLVIWGLVRAKDSIWQVWKKHRSEDRLVSSSDNPIDLSERAGEQLVAEVKFTNSRRRQKIPSPLEDDDSRILETAELVIRHRSGRVDTILRLKIQ